MVLSIAHQAIMHLYCAKKDKQLKATKKPKTGKKAPKVKEGVKSFDLSSPAYCKLVIHLMDSGLINPDMSLTRKGDNQGKSLIKNRMRARRKVMAAA